MARIRLRVYRDPGQAEVYLSIRDSDGNIERVTAVVDTGAQVSLFPISLMELLGIERSAGSRIEIEQAGIPDQPFEGVATTVTMALLDETGEQTVWFKARVWFGGRRHHVLGFRDILERAVLHIDAPNLTGYIEMP